MSKLPVPDANTRHGCLIFLHIPRTAGTTLVQIILRQYSRARTLAINAEQNERFPLQVLQALSESQRRDLLCLHGHIPFGFHKYMPQPCTYVTMLRDPVERMISHYYFVLSNSRHYLHESITSQHITLDDYVSGNITPELSNGQTQLLAGCEGRVTRDVLEVAKRNLRESFAVVGLTERFDESLVLMIKRLGWRRVYYRPMNAALARPARAAVPRSTIARIEQTNEMDLELYAFAVRLLEESIGAQGPQFEQDLRAFRFRNKIVGNLDRLNMNELRRQVSSRLVRWRDARWAR